MDPVFARESDPDSLNLDSPDLQLGNASLCNSIQGFFVVVLYHLIIVAVGHAWGVNFD